MLALQCNESKVSNGSSVSCVPKLPLDDVGRQKATIISVAAVLDKDFQSSFYPSFSKGSSAEPRSLREPFKEA